MATNAPDDPRPGALAGAGRSGLFCLSCRADYFPALSAFRYQLMRLWLRTLRRRSQKDRFTWEDHRAGQ